MLKFEYHAATTTHILFVLFHFVFLLAIVGQVVKSSKGVTIEPRTWVKRNKKLASLIFDEERLTRLLNVQDDEGWQAVSEDLATECKHDLGKLCFGDELFKVAATIADKLAVDEADEFVDRTSPIDRAQVKNAIQVTLQKVLKLAGIDKVPERRKVCHFIF